MGLNFQLLLYSVRFIVCILFFSKSFYFLTKWACKYRLLELHGQILHICKKLINNKVQGKGEGIHL